MKLKTWREGEKKGRREGEKEKEEKKREREGKERDPTSQNLFSLVLVYQTFSQFLELNKCKIVELKFSDVAST